MVRHGGTTATARSRGAGLAVVVAALFAVAGEPDEGLIEEIVVTVSKREQGLYEVPVAVSVFEGDTLGARGIDDLVDVGKFVPNLNVTTFSAGHTTAANPFIRGIGKQDHLVTTEPGVGVYVDGAYLGRQIGQHWYLSNIERVEVLRGPQGTLYGRNSIGGAINIVTAPPGTDRGTRVSTRLGSRGRLDLGAHTDAELTPTLALTLSGGMRRRGGVGAFRNLPGSGVEVGEMREVSARGALAWRPTPAFTLTIAADGNDGDNGLNPYTTLIDEFPHGAVYAAGYRNADVAADPYDNNTGQRDQTRVTNAARGLAVTADWQISERLALRSIGSARRAEYTAGLDDDSLRAGFLHFPEEGEARQESLEAQLLGDFGPLDFVAGLYRFAENGVNVQPEIRFLGSPGAFLLAQHVHSTAVFANVTVEFGERWRAGGGVRGTRDRKRAETDVGTGLVHGRRRWRDTSWDLSLHYSISDRLAVYATVQNGYQSGEFPARPYCLFADPDCFSASDNVTAVNRELGIKGQLRSALEVSAAVFDTRYEHLPYQVSTTAGAGFNTVNLIVEQRTRGFEWESAMHWGRGWRVGLGVGYIDVEVERQRGVRPVAPLTPRWTASVSPEYRRQLHGRGEIVARLDYSYRGAMWGEPSSDPARLTRIGGRGLVNFHLGYTAPDDAWTISVYGRNVGDVRYDHARLNTGDYLLRILSNDASEFGVRAEWRR